MVSADEPPGKGEGGRKERVAADEPRSKRVVAADEPRSPSKDERRSHQKKVTRNPKPENLNLKPETRNPKPETRNLKLRTREPKPETRLKGVAWPRPVDLPQVMRLQRGFHTPVSATKRMKQWRRWCQLTA